jgi:DeoR/GlpR family transcriptional regulator of sugar metabolism
MTIRRDLQILEEEGLIKRRYGGATILEKGKKSVAVSGSANCRRAIARYAASLVRDGETIFVNGSSTALMIAEELGDRHVQIITNNLEAIHCHHHANVGVALTGGNISDKERVLTGDFTISSLLQVRAERAFLGFAGISENGEVICNVTSEIGVHQIMMSRCSKFYLLMDHEKIGNLSKGAICSLESGGELITDQMADPAILEKLRKKGTRVTVVDSDRI